MAWTDNSRTALIELVKEKPVLWDRSLQSDPSARLLRSTALAEIADALNNDYYPSLSKTPYTVDELRSQWKNLKDTYKRKRRWLSEGKYSRDPAEEPTWKFFRQLRFLEQGEDCVGAQRDDPPSESNDAVSPELFMKAESSAANVCCEAENSMSYILKVTETEQEKQEDEVSKDAPTSSDLDEPCEKRSRIMKASHITLPQHEALDDFGQYGVFVAVTLRRLSSEGYKIEAHRLQKAISDVIFDLHVSIHEREKTVLSS